jgi:hypothetical protein
MAMEESTLAGTHEKEHECIWFSILTRKAAHKTDYNLQSMLHCCVDFFL